MVELVAHDPTWTATFERVRDRLREWIDEETLGVFHVGSTAVPGLPAKPCVDVLVVLPTREAARAASRALPDDYRRKRDRPDRISLIRDRESVSITVHLRPREADGWQDQLVFRELLRADPTARAMYEGAKLAAVAAHPDDGEAYTAAKEPVIERLVDRAYEEGYDDRLPIG